MNNKLTKAEILSELWHRGSLIYKCHEVQKEMYKIFYDSEKNSKLVWLLARQSGKSYLLSILALEQALKKPNSIIKFVTDTKLHIKSIVEPIFRDLLKDCPDNLKPEYKTNLFTYIFPNGSQIQLAGTDGKHYEKLRGQKTDLVLVDEAGFCSDLEEIIESVLSLTLLHTGGKIVLASTPPNDEDHDFIKYIEKAELAKKLTKKTIYDNPLLSKEQIEKIKEDMGGEKSERWRRECLCEIVKSTSLSVIPEFNDDLAKEIVKEWPKPPFYDSYVSMDIGGKDLTALIFGYYDFRSAKIIIEDELSFDFTEKDHHIKLLVEQIKEKENKLWLNVLTNELKKPFKRISDIDYIAQKEIYQHSYGELNFMTSRKDGKDSAINNLRVLLANKKIIINPRCVNLIRHLKNVKWKSQNNKEDFARSPDNGHYDFVDSLIYFSRNVDFSKNPYPSGYDLNLRQPDMFIQNYDKFYSSSPIETYKRIFGGKKLGSRR